MTVDRHQERVAAVVAGCFTVLAVVVYIVEFHLLASVPTVYIVQAANLIIVAAAVSMLAAVHAYLARRAAEEARDEVADTGERRLFENELNVTGQRQRALIHFQRFILPVILFVISLCEILLASHSFQWWFGQLPLAAIPNTSPLLFGCSLALLFAFLCFIIAKYCAGLAYEGDSHYLRPVAAVSLGAAASFAVAGVGALLLYWGHDYAGTIAVVLTAGSASVFAVERIVVWIVDFYRPQSHQLDIRPVYESRLLGLFSQPQGVVGNLADLLDYQFGFQISQKWFYGFVQRGLLPFVLFQLLTLWALSSLVYIRPHEHGFIEQWGQERLSVLEPGLYVRAPWPISRVHRLPTARSQLLSIVAPAHIRDDDAGADVELWQDRDLKHSLFLVGTADDDAETARASLGAVTVALRYRIHERPDYLTHHSNPRDVLLYLSRRTVGNYLREGTLTSLLSDDFSIMGTTLKRRIQAHADRHRLGVVIDGVTVEGLQPPPEVAAVYQDIFSAHQKRREMHGAAEAYAVVVDAAASHQSNRRVREAEAETARSTRFAAVEVNSFDQQQAIYSRHRRLYTTRAAMASLERWLDDARKVIISADVDREVIDLELKKKRADLLSTFEGESAPSK